MNNTHFPVEHVLVFPTEVLHQIGYFQGLKKEVEPYLKVIFDPKVTQYKVRTEVESNVCFKQLIPYVVLKCGDQVYTYVRGRELSEKRLLDKYSIGLGGHIVAEDESLFSNVYDRAMEREIEEEVTIGSEYTQQRVALINDDFDEVGAVHFGIVEIFELKEPKVKKKEQSIKKARFVPIKWLKKNIDKFERWSQLCIKEIL